MDEREFEGRWLGTEVGRQVHPVIRRRRLRLLVARFLIRLRRPARH
jgi:hypothetical protein